MQTQQTTATGRTILRTVTPATLSLEVDKPCVFTIEKRMFLGEVREADKAKDKKAPTILEVTFIDGEGYPLEAGRLCHLVAGAALEARLNDSYPAADGGPDDYVNKTFEVTKRAKVKSASSKGDGYFPYDVFQVEA